MAPENENLTPPKHKLNLHLDLRFIVLLLLIAIGVMLLLWKPWQNNPKSTDRTISITGEATVKSEPDEYIFMPTYDFTNLTDLTKKSDDVIAQLKKLGVQDSQIQSNSNGSSNVCPYCLQPVQDNTDNSYTLSLTVTLNNRQLSQKVQDYLVSTQPTGQVSPQYTFSEAKRKQLESQARGQATQDARSKVEQSAKNLGFKIGAVKSVTDYGGGGIEPLRLNSLKGAASADSAQTQLSVQPGQNELSFSVTVVYYIH